MYEGRDIYVFTVCSHFGGTDALIVTPLLVHVHRHMHASTCSYIYMYMYFENSCMDVHNADL